MKHAALIVMAFASCALCCAQSVQAAVSYPDRPVRLLVGFAAGGPTDLPARVIAEQLTDLLGQRVIVENRAGAGGMLAARYVLGQPSDGHTLLLCTHQDGVNAALYKDASYTLDDIAPISMTSRYYFGLTVSNKIPADTLGQFFEHVRANPGTLSYATIGRGTPPELVVRQLEKIANISMNQVPFRSTPQIFQDLISDRIQLFLSPTLAVMPHYAAGKVKVLAVTSPERMKEVPAVPTLTESGVDLQPFGWLGVCAAAGTPQPIIERLNGYLRTIVASEEYRAMIRKGGAIPASSSPEELKQIMHKTVDDAAPIIRELQLQQ